MVQTLRYLEYLWRRKRYTKVLLLLLVQRKRAKAQRPTLQQPSPHAKSSAGCPHSLPEA